ncbi:MAG TPA: nucleotide exchange factor GrpE [Pyrinomonadaceae bacterium]|jgi:molecular chaperone GrpE|nr:nucleotide exchange factor GrpE [Pyrinomonadaceae bacterium]
MTQTNMPDKNGRKPNRIPVRFDDEAQAGRGDEESPELKGEGGVSPEEIGRESSYEDATEVERRVGRGAEPNTEAGRSDADKDERAGGPDPSELPQSRNEQDTNASHTTGEEQADERKAGSGDASKTQDEQPRSADASAGPVLAELVATRAELRRVEAALKKVADERREWADKLARRQADFDNFRKRTERERGETYNRALGEVVRRLLPVIDNLQRALEAERTLETKESNEFRHFLHGVELINKQLGGVLESLGVEVVPTVGELFDPHVHEAVATEEADEVEPDTIVQEMQRGYRLRDKLLRPAMVKVATKA